jgi:hypothetical protein
MPFVEKKDTGSRVGQAIGAALGAVPAAIDWAQKRRQTEAQIAQLEQQSALLKQEMDAKQAEQQKMAEEVEAGKMWTMAVSSNNPEATFSVHRDTFAKTSPLTGTFIDVLSDPTGAVLKKYGLALKATRDSLSPEELASLTGIDSTLQAGMNYRSGQAKFDTGIQKFQTAANRLISMNGATFAPHLRKYADAKLAKAQEIQKLRSEAQTELTKTALGRTEKTPPRNFVAENWSMLKNKEASKADEAADKALTMRDSYKNALALSNRLETGAVSGSDSAIAIRKIIGDEGLKGWLKGKWSGKRDVPDAEDAEKAIGVYAQDLQKQALEFRKTDPTKADSLEQQATDWQMLQQVMAEIRTEAIKQFAADAGVRSIDTKPEQEMLFQSILNGKLNHQALRAIANKNLARIAGSQFLAEQRNAYIEANGGNATGWNNLQRQIRDNMEIIVDANGNAQVIRMGEAIPEGFASATGWAQGKVKVKGEK